MAGIGQFNMGRSIVSESGKSLGSFDKPTLYCGKLTRGPNNNLNVISAHSYSVSLRNNRVVRNEDISQFRSSYTPDPGLDSQQSFLPNFAAQQQSKQQRGLSDLPTFPASLSSSSNLLTPTSGSTTKNMPLSSGFNLSTATSSPNAGTVLDPSEFPPIRPGSSTVATTSKPNQTQSSQASRNYLIATPKNNQSLHSDSSSHNSPYPPPPEFSIEQDFPALPGSQASTSTTSRSQPPTPQPSVSNGLQLMDSHVVANIPKNMISDQFGMIGLLKLIRVGDYDTTLNMLAPGLDLTSLNIKWDTSDELYNSFISPCHDSCMARPQDIDYPVPSEYLMRHLIADHIPDPSMDKLSESTLFWLFYNCCREEVQLVVARELYQRYWRFHIKKQVWLTRVPGAELKQSGQTEQGVYQYWDPISAQRSTQQMTINYAELDNAPSAFHTSSGLLSASIINNTYSSGPSSSSANPAPLQMSQLDSALPHQSQQHNQAGVQNALSGVSPHNHSTGSLMSMFGKSSSTVQSSSSQSNMAALVCQQQLQIRQQLLQQGVSSSMLSSGGIIGSNTNPAVAASSMSFLGSSSANQRQNQTSVSNGNLSAVGMHSINSQGLVQQSQVNGSQSSTVNSNGSNNNNSNTATSSNTVNSSAGNSMQNGTVVTTSVINSTEKELTHQSLKDASKMASNVTSSNLTH